MQEKLRSVVLIYPIFFFCWEIFSNGDPMHNCFSLSFIHTVFFKMFFGSMLTTTTANTLAGDSSKSNWILSGHEGDVLGLSVLSANIFASCDINGVGLVWDTRGDTVDNVCKFSSGGPPMLQMSFLSHTELVCAQGNGSCVVYNIERGVRSGGYSRLSDEARVAWPVMNAVKQLDRHSFLTGGDEGYLLAFDTRQSGALSSINIRTPITSIGTADEYVFVGDACGDMHWFDKRTNKKVTVLPLCKSPITTINRFSNTEVVFLSRKMVGTVDIQPFALDDAHRLTTHAGVDIDEDCRLPRCCTVEKTKSVHVPSQNGKVQTLWREGGTFSSSVRRISDTAEECTHVVEQMQNGKYLLCAGGNRLRMFEV
ncbi:U5 snRNP-specific 40 kDa protein [Angomonas deanei]|uniref:WD domain, G-beta repeat n=1 Tax=Angomonas deanei TaxID=59799 RepID=A0A7G2CIB6_9TRYP|nr:U5 snRNP-specific 40 kDa protein [Angomonas deanei]CAD2218701.1 hypothetical protein, conserved [Angomonas deanei]|eukprot:EPY41189.1 U5 snRNP-specific 40 kDa protein [Angomonas deanei]